MATGNKTGPTTASVPGFLAGVEPRRRREDATVLRALFEELTGWQGVMWGSNIVGFGAYHDVYASGREGDFLATGFSPRKTGLSIYILPGYQDDSALLARLGKHRAGASCLSVNTLADIDLDVLRELIKRGLADLSGQWPVRPS
ncbi:MAG: DUF1801 domain-containing protein [Pseudomonadota bacterium]